MHIILTHEQADFDGVASVLGAGLLQEKAVPVLPLRKNRNVQSFLNIYQSELGLVEQRDLAGDRIEAVTLVDTQSLVTLKGIHKSSRVNVVDHHRLRKSPPVEWQVKIDPTGACTTIFVEELRNRALGLTALQATLLLLGIYEDTGSLTYVSTTARDVHAAAYLMEQGASLRIAARFLNPPLSDEQKAVYDGLLSAAEAHQVHGLKVILSCVSAEGLVEEISSIAHKLRDLLEPDALILIVKTNEGIRLIGRSTTDQVDVSRIMAEFGGGGHERAASALIRLESEQPTLDSVQQKLLHVLDQHIQPAITVGQIMSSRPKTLSPDTSVQSAGKLMQRYGYEGYPILKDNVVIGLLTRRSVDRALSHKLNLTVESLMDAGQVFVHPADSLDHLQRVMAASGWGQIPVLDPTSGKLLGIVTRTDLLKTLGKELVSVPGHVNLSDRLESALSASRLGFLKLVADLARENHFPVYIVGGFVRDLILDRPCLDFDMVVEGDAISLGKILSQTFGGRLTTHSRFGTAKWLIDDARGKIQAALKLPIGDDDLDLPESLDLISARTEFYEFPTALPTVERSSIKLDLHRRDFTINTLALRLDGRHFGNLYDFWGGLNDLQKGVIRVLHSLSFVDDPTRMLRAIRFEQRFGFQIEPRTLKLIAEARDLLAQVSGDRVRHEFDLILAEHNPPAIFSRMQELGLLSVIYPAIQWDASQAPAINSILNEPIHPAWQLPEVIHGSPTRQMAAYLVWLASLPLPHLMGVAVRLHFSRLMTEALQQTHLLLADLPTLTHLKPSQITARLDDLPPVVLYAAYVLSTGQAERQLLENARDQWLKTQPFTDGKQLSALGIPPGPAYKYLITRLRNAWLDGEIHNQEEEQALLSQYRQSIPPEFTPLNTDPGK